MPTIPLSQGSLPRDPAIEQSVEDVRVKERNLIKAAIKKKTLCVHTFEAVENQRRRPYILLHQMFVDLYNSPESQTASSGHTTTTRTAEQLAKLKTVPAEYVKCKYCDYHSSSSAVDTHEKSCHNQLNEKAQLLYIQNQDIEWSDEKSLRAQLAKYKNRFMKEADMNIKLFETNPELVRTRKTGEYKAISAEETARKVIRTREVRDAARDHLAKIHSDLRKSNR